MKRQHRSNRHLLQLYGRVISLCIVLMILAILSFRYFSAIERNSAPTLQIEQSRLINILAMIHSQWLSQGRPKQIKPDWLGEQVQKDSLILMGQQGWPILNKVDDQSCERLWTQLLGERNDLKATITTIALSSDMCLYSHVNGEQIRYQLDSSNVIFSTTPLN